MENIYEVLQSLVGKEVNKTTGSSVEIYYPPFKGMERVLYKVDRVTSSMIILSDRSDDYSRRPGLILYIPIERISSIHIYPTELTK